MQVPEFLCLFSGEGAFTVQACLPGQRHVAQHRGAVPAAFAHRISLAAHQKAADYTLAKARVSLIDITLSAVVLLGWTLLGGLNALNLWLYDRLDAGLWQQLALLASFAVISAAIELPLSLYQTFKLEQRCRLYRHALRPATAGARCARGWHRQPQ